VKLTLEKHDIVVTILNGHNWQIACSGVPADYLAALASTVDFVLGDPDRRQRYLDQTLALVKAFTLSVSDARVLALRDDVGFFQDVRNQILKLEAAGGSEPGGAKSHEELDTAIGQIISKAVAAGGVVDIYEAAGLDKPELSILSDEFLEDIKKLPQKNLQIELLRKLLNDEIRSVGKTNVVQSKKFSEMLGESIVRYQNRSLTSAEVIAELVALAKALQVEHDRGAELGLSEAELAFYDAVRQNDAAVLELGDEQLRQIALEVVATVKQNARSTGT
jgi:type I restriction enzyme R subunit